jgi:hypothetical protein
LLKDLQGEFAAEDDIQFSYTDSKTGKTKLGDYLYFTEDYGLGEEGWYSEEMEPIGDTQYLKWGQGVWFIGSDGPKDITTSGEVTKGHKIHTMTDPKTLIANFYPVPFCPNSASVSWPNVQAEDDIQVAYTQAGKTKLRDYLYFTEDYGLGDEGWYNEDMELLDPTFPIAGVGEGFWYIPGDFESAAIAEVSPLGDEESK